MLSDFIDQFPLDADIIYLNHAAIAPLPRCTVDAIQQFALENLYRGMKRYTLWEEREKQLREQMRILLNAPSSDEIALLKNTSEALSVVAYGLGWQAGDNIVITNQEFPSNRIVWESLCTQGVNVRQADISDFSDPETAIFNLVDERTRLIAVSSVQYASGLCMDLNKLGAFCRNHAILFCVDAIQSLGALPLDVQAIQADFVMADGHKWLLSLEGLAVFYCRAQVREQLQLKQFGWRMVENPLDFDVPTWTIANSGRRFECGSPNMIGICALSASVGLLQTVGVLNVANKVRDNAQMLIQGLNVLPDIEVLSAQNRERHAGIVTFRHKTKSTQALFQQLIQQGIICAKRGGGIRLSPHFYTITHQLQQVLTTIEQLI